ncbi:MAG: hypothetical protein QOE33_3685 [Acidobacteriota bacterium]|jgi:hypothetical protein|nr:hypothetical protein [Acidobacteriota bacterium]
MGNKKPDVLATVEKQLWTTLLNIASGVSVLDGLQTFLEQYKKIEAEVEPKLLNIDWFARGKSVSWFSLHPSDIHSC